LGIITNRGDSIQYAHTDSGHTDLLFRITPIKLIDSNECDKEQYLDMLLDSSVSNGGMEFIKEKKTLRQQRQSCKMMLPYILWKALSEQILKLEIYQIEELKTSYYSKNYR
jgi:hypothetical protein